MKFKGLYARWHRYNIIGKKQSKQFPIDGTPDPIKEVDFTEWKRGTGPHSAEAMVKLRCYAARTAGIPKSPATKRKMSEAAQGRPKSAKHRESMKIAQMQRWSKVSGST